MSFMNGRQDFCLDVMTMLSGTTAQCALKDVVSFLAYAVHNCFDGLSDRQASALSGTETVKSGARLTTSFDSSHFGFVRSVEVDSHINIESVMIPSCPGIYIKEVVCIFIFLTFFFQFSPSV